MVKTLVVEYWRKGVENRTSKSAYRLAVMNQGKSTLSGRRGATVAWWMLSLPPMIVASGLERVGRKQRKWL